LQVRRSQTGLVRVRQHLPVIVLHRVLPAGHRHAQVASLHYAHRHPDCQPGTSILTRSPGAKLNLGQCL
jgi:hypothetical protein